MDYPQRKPNRLKEYDYSMPGAYFITICTEHKRKLFWKASDIGCSLELSKYGEIVNSVVVEIPDHYPMITVDHYVIMPNHVHLLLQIHTDENGEVIPAPSISTVVHR